jgi:Transglycosylase SLT domain
MLLIIALAYYFSSSSSGTAIIAPDTTTGTNTLITTSDTGLSPVDIGGTSLNIPNAVLQWQDLANKYSEINSILDPEEILAIIWNESSGNPNANNLNDPSYGLMGVTILIGNAYAGANTPTELYVPETNIKAGSAFLAHLKNKFLLRFPDTWSDGYNEGETQLNLGRILTPGYSQAFNDHVNALKGIG